MAGGYGYGYGGGFGAPVVVQRSDGGSGLITILVVIAAIYVISQVAGNFIGGGDGDGSGKLAEQHNGLLGFCMYALLGQCVLCMHFTAGQSGQWFGCSRSDFQVLR